ncbi:unnamed protein product [Nyctereutes procyonoides]|uniref:(raccoon dog) hypothetical protein n=1 Tax=Nyctereutes procyonoides TaxID=34880 RepID=A0A811ZE35_NYCPR|nr:unnamed protein product [Nyctereutes procyonoides]
MYFTFTVLLSNTLILWSLLNGYSFVRK